MRFFPLDVQKQIEGATTMTTTLLSSRYKPPRTTFLIQEENLKQKFLGLKTLSTSHFSDDVLEPSEAESTS